MTDGLAIHGLRFDEMVVTSNFSRVYRAWDVALARAVAVKVFHLDPEREATLPYPREVWRRRFIAEARLLAGIDHPHVVRVNGLDHLPDGTPYMVMPWYVANLRREIGRDKDDAHLPELERPRRVSPVRAVEIIRQLCLGLAVLHAKGYVHRDVKPTNLLLTAREGGAIKLCDLGMAKLPDELSQALARRGVWIGTPDYVAPEQRRDASQVDDRADVYSVGVLAYRLVSGKLPDGPEPPLDAQIPEEFARLIHAALAVVPSQRPTALQMAALLSVIGSESPKAGIARMC
ncbi:MAG: serine/threonine protein kinase [Rhodospirillaceae bacterium]|nr:serine/threonine protein kinase [Rhodospirillales bacterium]